MNITYPEFTKTKQEHVPLTEEEFALYEPFLDYDYTYARLKISVKLEHEKDRRGVVVKFGEEVTGKILLKAIRNAQEMLIISVKDILDKRIQVQK